MTGTPANTSQGWVTYRFAAQQSAGTIVHVVSGGTSIGAYRAAKAFRQVTLSSSQVVGGRSYDVYTGGSVSGTAVGGFPPTGNLADDLGMQTTRNRVVTDHR
jgi:hypothetical protein